MYRRSQFIVERCKLNTRLDSKLLIEQVSVGIVVRKGGGSLPTRMQQQHTLAMRDFVQGIKAQESSDACEPFRIGSHLQMVRHKRVQRLYHVLHPSLTLAL